MKPGDLVMTKRDGSVALVLDNGDMIGIEEGTHAIVLNVDIDPLDPYMNEVRVLHPSFGPCYINGSALDVIDETG